MKRILAPLRSSAESLRDLVVDLASAVIVIAREHVRRDEQVVPTEPEPTSYDEAYNEAVQHAADEQANLWGVAHFAAWETEYFMRGADS